MWEDAASYPDCSYMFLYLYIYGKSRVCGWYEDRAMAKHSLTSQPPDLLNCTSAFPAVPVNKRRQTQGSDFKASWMFLFFLIKVRRLLTSSSCWNPYETKWGFHLQILIIFKIDSGQSTNSGLAFHKYSSQALGCVWIYSLLHLFPLPYITIVFFSPVFIQERGLSVRELDSLIFRSDFVMLSLETLRSNILCLCSILCAPASTLLIVLSLPLCSSALGFLFCLRLNKDPIENSLKSTWSVTCDFRHNG